MQSVTKSKCDKIIGMRAKKTKAEKKVNSRREKKNTKRNELELSIFWNFIFLSNFFCVVVGGVNGVF